MPSVFRPGICITFTGVTLEPCLLFVLPALFRPWKKKSSATTSFGFLQTNPFTSTGKFVITHNQLSMDSVLCLFLFTCIL
ncbi:hypothetical protein QJS04_geneDACA014424 [Acorus gramineus]|uniref:Uncharacterized protein n=1 Tax=Acorus gramineus TaxID=55184 RepID=A0AAV9BMV9_ACOGR|nr:hypothetical protein QJS04_geneDACA014424 [Acorus gramineus]